MGLTPPLQGDPVRGTQRLFVYGTLRRGSGWPMARMLALKARYCGQGQINGRLYHLGSYPGALPSRHPGEWVRGDLYDLADVPRLFAKIDRYEGLGTGRGRPAEYQRVIITVHMDDGSAVQAWTYLTQRPVKRLKRLISGDFLR